MKVFSIRKMIEDDCYIGRPDDYLYEWALDCDGKTEKECDEIGMLIAQDWLVEEADFHKTPRSQYEKLLKAVLGKDYSTVCKILNVPAIEDYSSDLKVGDKVEALNLLPVECEWGVDFLIGAIGTIVEFDPTPNGQNYYVTFDKIMPLDGELNTQSWWFRATDIRKVK